MADTVYYFKGGIGIGAGAGTPGDPANVIDALGPFPTIILADGDTLLLSNEVVHTITGSNNLSSTAFPSNTKPIQLLSTDSSWNPVGADEGAIIDGSGLTSGAVLTIDDPWWWLFNIQLRNGPGRGLYVTGDGFVGIGIRTYGHISDGLDIALSADYPYLAYSHFNDNGAAGVDCSSTRPLGFYRCSEWGNTTSPFFQSSAIGTTGHLPFIGCVAVVEGSSTFPAVTSGNLLMIDSVAVSSDTTAPTDALVLPRHNAIVVNSILDARTESVTGLKAASVTSTVLGGNIYHGLSLDVGANITVKADYEIGAHVVVDPGFANVPSDMTPTEDLSGYALYVKLAAEASGWIQPGAVEKGSAVAGSPRIRTIHTGGRM